MLGIGREIGIFLWALLSGAIVYSVYMAIRGMRRLVKHNLLAVTVEDFFFWSLASVYLFIQIYRTSDGSIRWFFILGVVVGMAITSCLMMAIYKAFRSYNQKIKKKR